MKFRKNYILEIFPEGTIIPAFRRPKNLKELLAPSRLKPESNSISSVVENEKANYGYFKYNRKCDLCANYFKDSNC